MKALLITIFALGSFQLFANDNMSEFERGFYEGQKSCTQEKQLLLCEFPNLNSDRVFRQDWRSISLLVSSKEEALKKMGAHYLQEMKKQKKDFTCTKV